MAEDGEETAGGSGYAEEFSPPPEAMEPTQQSGAGDEGGAAAAAAAAEGLQDRRARCLEWCLDNGFEYVEADCRDLERGAVRFRGCMVRSDQRNGSEEGVHVGMAGIPFKDRSQS